MRSRTTKRFRSAFSSLPEPVKRQARQAFRLFFDNPDHPGLQFKKVLPGQPIYSARVNIQYRALCLRSDDEAIWFWIGSHADYDTLLTRFRRKGSLPGPDA